MSVMSNLEIDLQIIQINFFPDLIHTEIIEYLLKT